MCQDREIYVFNSFNLNTSKLYILVDFKTAEVDICRSLSKMFDLIEIYFLVVLS